MKTLKKLEKKTLKIGDTVMFTDFEGLYARWFAGKIGHVRSISDKGTHCSVRWLEPVRYHESFTSVSSFDISKFEVYNEDL